MRVRAWMAGLLAAAACAAPRPASVPDGGAEAASSRTTVATVAAPTAEDVQRAIASYPANAPHAPPPPIAALAPEPLDVAVRRRARACLLQSALARDPAARGRVSLRVVMGDDDVVASASEAGTSLRDRTIVACLVSNMIGVRVVVRDQELADPIVLARGTAVTLSIVLAP